MIVISIDADAIVTDGIPIFLVRFSIFSAIHFTRFLIHDGIQINRTHISKFELEDLGN